MDCSAMVRGARMRSASNSPAAKRWAMRGTSSYGLTRVTCSWRPTASCRPAPMVRLVNRLPARGPAVALGLLPFILLVIAYLVGSHIRLAENPSDKLLPTPGTLVSTLHSYAAEEDVRSGEILFWLDTVASLKRIFIALTLSASIGLALGLAMGAIPFARAVLAPFISAVGMIPPLAILPILFIVVGLGETAKITLMTIGIAPCIARDLALRASELPAEQLIKAQTLGASSWQLVTRVILPQMWPRLIDAVRL